MTGVAVVKPLEWHKSHINSWNGDYHTVPTGYTVRCADENGWRWSGFGAHGYSNSPQSAQSAAQADYAARILSAITIRSAADIRDEVLEEAAAAAFESASGHPRTIAAQIRALKSRKEQ